MEYVRPSLPEKDRSPEFDFRLLLAFVRAHFGQAVSDQEGLKEYRLFTIVQRQTDAPDTLAKFTIADSKKLHDLFAADTVELAVPIKEPDVDRPELLESEDGSSDYFVLYKRDGEQLQSVIVDGYSADSVMHAAEPFIEHVDDKILTYQVVPRRKTQA